jgi:hypothetical protein
MKMRMAMYSTRHAFHTASVAFAAAAHALWTIAMPSYS